MTIGSSPTTGTPAVGPPLVIAHRGYSAVAPENTLAAFEAALRCGAHMVETDLHPAADGSAVLIHDAEVDATTGGSGLVADLGPAELTRLDAGSWFSPAYRGQRVPLLVDLLDLLTEHPGAQLLLELKGVWGRAEVEGVLRDLRRTGALDQVVLQSFEVGTLTAVQRLAPGVRRAVLLDELDDDALAQGRALRRDLGVIACNPSVAALAARPAAVAELHAAGLQVWPWTVDEAALWRALVEAGVDGVITNRPDGLLGWLEAREDARPEPADLLLAALAQRGRSEPGPAAAPQRVAAR
ncbi:glycerophosphodiester phosphodiesterase [Kineococcus sp. SYSU DK002]|uniref:glycerophosphodiester phosphodiesterase n=1 Tax=Kineococcus sp. SYSU DK002 TaxID=3383123 RepID=UPI003D7E1025